LRRIVFFLCFVCVMAGLAAAQSMPPNEVFGGFSYERLLQSNLDGWHGALTHSFTDVWGITGEIAGHYGSGISSESFLGGPEIHYRMEKVKPFGHFLMGIDHVSAGGDGSTSFAVGFGGGLDVTFAKNIAFRIGELDYLHTNHFDTGQNGVRFSTGVVFSFGGESRTRSGRGTHRSTGGY